MTQTFIIHLERASERRPDVEAMMDLSPYPARIWPACDGAAMDPAARDALIADQPLFQPAYPFPLSMGEIGCFESHRSVWRHMVEHSLPSALIFEDDVLIDGPVFADALKLAEACVGKAAYIQFQVREVKAPFQVVEQSGTVAVIRPQTVPLRASAQLVSLEAATALLKTSTAMDRPVDVYLQMFWETGIRPHCVVPSGVTDVPSPTTIQSKRSFVQKLRAEVQRFIYRRKIGTLSAQRG
ncbi:glycosyltransferase family 25 protein [Litoreibacter arenae]|uniref:Glycosyl transferase, family 25 n=1 Tax=Litoreibacter arenae DSM 19593 TaxID=1123360 RepID=S9RU79_9RHOB|nr:glycosyltransferase family 25 protein [Litoreibacter arenae]EPX77499.1 glycosyl transferase, family 25 [Litoreibacter arenae DSM 19593]